jgi:hypothetical protein
MQDILPVLCFIAGFALAETGTQLRAETGKLVAAPRAPDARGAGE